MSDPLISVVMPVLNGRPFLASAAESLLRQTYTNWELVLVDDGSTDCSLELASKAVGEKLVSVRHDRSLGVAQSLNDGLEKANGQYIARLDSDDIAEPERLRAQVRELTETQSAMTFNWYTYIDRRDRRVPSPRLSSRIGQADLAAVLILGNPLCHPGLAYDRNRVELTYPTNQQFEDYWLWMDKALSYTLSVTPTPLTRWRLHGGNQSKVKTSIGHRLLAPKLEEFSAAQGVYINLATAELLLDPNSRPMSLADLNAVSLVHDRVVTRLQSAGARTLAHNQIAGWALRSLSGAGISREVRAMLLRRRSRDLAAIVPGALWRRLQRRIAESS